MRSVADSAPAGRLWRLVGWLVLLLVVLAYPIRYAQQITFGRVILYTGLIRLFLFLVIFALAAWAAARKHSRDQLRLIAIGYLLVFVVVYNMMVVDFGIFYLAYGFDIFYIPPAIAVLFFLNAEYFPTSSEEGEDRIVRLLLMVAVPIAALGIVQYALNDPILRLNYPEAPQDEFGSAGQAVVRLTALAATGHVRANSIFGSAIDFGHFDVLFGLLSLGMALRSRRRPVAAICYLVLTGIFIAAAASTSTRNILVYFACCMIGCVFILAGFGVRVLVTLALSSVAIFYGTIYGVIELAPRFFLGFFDVVSLFQRARGVYTTVDRYIVNADSLTHVLFGFGHMQSLDFKFLPTAVFDNTELDIYLYAGICGLAAYGALLLVLFGQALRMWRQTHSVAWLAAASLLVGTPLFSTLNIDLDQPFLLFIFALTVGGWSPVDRRPTVFAGGATSEQQAGWKAA